MFIGGTFNFQLILGDSTPESAIQKYHAYINYY